MLCTSSMGKELGSVPERAEGELESRHGDNGVAEGAVWEDGRETQRVPGHVSPPLYSSLPFNLAPMAGDKCLEHEPMHVEMNFRSNP